MNRQELLKIAKPILFSTPMVQAILHGSKTVTRRVIKRDITNFCDVETDGTLLNYQNCYGDFVNPVDLCRYKAGDILYVRETWAQVTDLFGEFPQYIYRTNYGTTEDDTFPPSMFKWKPSIHMPKEAARIFLKVTEIRVERLQDITIDECFQEGIREVHGMRSEARKWFWELWDSVIKKQDLDKYNWNANPWVWTIEFERVLSDEYN